MNTVHTNVAIEEPQAKLLDGLPKAMPLMLQAAGTSRRKPRGEIVIPRLAVEVRNVRANADRLVAYRELCGFASSDSLPITFPQVQAAPLHMWLMVQPEFPLPLLGIVHLRNRIEQFSPLPAEGSYTVRASVGESRRIRQGLEFDLHTEYLDDSGTVLSRSVTSALSRLKTDESKPRAKPESAAVGIADYRSFDVPADTGRRYAPIGQDYNPIHLYAATAKLFGFPRAIAHGMWSVARCVALIEDQLASPPRELDVQFRKPVLLPAQVALKFRQEQASVDFSLLSRRSDNVHLSGSLR